MTPNVKWPYRYYQVYLDGVAGPIMVADNEDDALEQWYATDAPKNKTVTIKEVSDDLSKV